MTYYVDRDAEKVILKCDCGAFLKDIGERSFEEIKNTSTVIAVCQICKCQVKFNFKNEGEILNAV